MMTPEMKAQTEANKAARKTWVGLRIRQVRSSSPEFEKYIGRTSTVTDAFVDENGTTHVQTEDGFWCPAFLLITIS